MIPGALAADGERMAMELPTNLPRWREGIFECRVLRCATDQGFVLVRDITEQRQAEAAQTEARKRAEEAVETLAVIDTAETALALLDTRAFDLVLMDLHLPGIDGYEACRRLRADDGPNKQCVVVALTAHAVDGDDARCRAVGMDGHLIKASDAIAVADWLERAMTQTKQRT